MTQISKPNRLSVEFLWNAAVTLICIGAAFGTLKVTLNSVQADVTVQNEKIKSIELMYLRVDVYEAKHQALLEQLKGMAADIHEIKAVFYPPASSIKPSQLQFNK